MCEWFRKTIKGGTNKQKGQSFYLIGAPSGSAGSVVFGSNRGGPTVLTLVFLALACLAWSFLDLVMLVVYSGRHGRQLE